MKNEDPGLFAPGGCNHVKKCKCDKRKPYKLLKTGMVGGPSIIFCRYAEKGKTRIRDHIYKKEAKKEN